MDKLYDIVTFGEGLLRLSPPRYERLEQANLFDVHVIGPSLEVAVNASRIGLKSAWISAVGETPLGAKIVNKVREHGVEVSSVTRVPDGRTGLCFLEPGSAPRPDRFFYDADHTALRRVAPESLSWAALQRSRLCQFSLTGLDVNPETMRLVESACSAALDSHNLISVSVDDTAALPIPGALIPRVARLIGQAQICVVTRRAAVTVLNCVGSAEEIAASIQSRYGVTTVVVIDNHLPTPRTGVWRSVARTDRVHEDRSYALEVIDAGGALSAFTAAFLYGVLKETPDAGLHYGNAAAALAHTIPGHFNWCTLADLYAQIQGTGTKLQR